MSTRSQYEAEERAFLEANEPVYSVEVKHPFKGVALSTMVPARNIAKVVDLLVDAGFLPEAQGGIEVTIALRMTGWSARVTP